MWLTTEPYSLRLADGGVLEEIPGGSLRAITGRKEEEDFQKACEVDSLRLILTNDLLIFAVLSTLFGFILIFMNT